MWPLCLIRDEEENRSGDSGHYFTEELQTGMSFTQNFRAEESFLGAIDYALSFDATLPLEGKFLFELADSDGKVLYSQEYPFNLTPDYSYCRIEVNQRLKKGEVYQYRLTNLDVAQNFPQVVYTQDAEMHAENNCGMTFNGEAFAGEALSQYTWEVPMDWWKILGYSGFMGIFVFTIYELEEMRMARRKHRQKSDKEN